MLSQRALISLFVNCVFFFFFQVQEEEEELSRYTVDRMVWTPEYLARNALVRINMYKDNMLRPLEVSCPDQEQLPSTCSTVSPGTL